MPAKCGSSSGANKMCVSVNDLGAAGVTAVAEALKVNTSVQEIHLGSEWCWCSLPNVPVW